MRLLKNRDGFGFGILIMLVTLIVIVLICQNYLLTTTNNVLMTANVADAMRAYYIADAGLSRALLALKSAGVDPASFNDGNPAYPVSPTQTGSYAFIVTRIPMANSTTEYTISSTGTYKGTNKTLVLRVRQAPLSRWGYNTNLELVDPAQAGTYTNPLKKWFITGQTVGGPCNTNDPFPTLDDGQFKNQFNIWGNPVFEKTVTQVAADINYYPGVTCNPDFQGGFTPNSPAITQASGLIGIVSAAAGTTKETGKFTGDTTIVLQSDGSVKITNVAATWTNHSFNPPSKAIYVTGGEIKLSGTLKGQLTIACDGDGSASPTGRKGDIRIVGSVLYNDTNLATSTDMLGLVANRSVKLDDALYPTRNISVYGYIVAVNGSLYADDWDTPSGGATRYFLEYGGTTSHYARLGGTFNTDTGALVTGYLSILSYDDRLATMMPPYFNVALLQNGNPIYEKVSYNEPY